MLIRSVNLHKEGSVLGSKDDRIIYGDGFRLVPVSFIPPKDYSNRKTFKDKALEDWKWQEFLFYWRHMLTEYGGEDKEWPRNPKEWGAFKGKIEPSRVLRGNELFKAMVDMGVSVWWWNYPEPEHYSIDLICGEHPWSERIAKQAEKYIVAIKSGEREMGVVKISRFSRSEGEDGLVLYPS